MSKSNGGGRNNFYDIPDYVTNVDSLAKYLKATGPMFNILKSLFGLNANRHKGTSSVRDSEKIIHYAIENYIWQEDTEATKHEDVYMKLISEMPNDDRANFIKRLSDKYPIKKDE